jgi:simple sugar transport system substrate-binding protein
MYKNLVAALAAACFAPARPDAHTRGLGLCHPHPGHRLDAPARAGTAGGAKGGQVVTTHVDNVAEGPDAERVIRDLARQGNDIIFTTSFGYMEPALKVAREFPQVKFEVVTGVKRAPNVATANARYYEGRYLSGIAAGRMTKTGVVGYVAGFPIPEVLQGINAFTLGLRSVNPKARSSWCGSTSGSTRRASATPP